MTLNKNYIKYLLITIVSQLICFSTFAYKITTLEYLDIPDEIPFFDSDGKKIYLDQFENKTILLVFWATWCAPCIKEMPDLDMLQKDFRKLPFKIIAVSQDFQGIKIVKQYFQDQEIRHLDIYHDYQNELFKAFSVIGIPTSFLINQDGKMVASLTGSINWYDKEVRDMLLSHIRGDHPVPKNSYREQSLNQSVKPKDRLFKEKETQSTDKPLDEEVKNVDKLPQHIKGENNENNE